MKDKSLLDAYACSADIGRINPAPAKVLTPTHPCPQIINPETLLPIDKKMMSKEQCIIRIREGADCVENCKVAKKLSK